MDAEKKETKKYKIQILWHYHRIFQPCAVRPQVLICFSGEFSDEKAQSWEDYSHASISIGFHDFNDEGEERA